MDILDRPSRWTPEQIFNRLCRRTERHTLLPMSDRSKINEAMRKSKALGKQLSSLMSEVDENSRSRNDSAQLLADTLRAVLNEASVFFTDKTVIKRCGLYCQENPQDLRVDPFPRFPFPATVIANPFNAVLLFDADDGSHEGDSFSPGARWRCKFVGYYQEDDAWFHVFGTCELHEPDSTGTGRAIVTKNRVVQLAYTEDGDGEWAGLMSTMREEKPEEAAGLSEVISQTLGMAFDMMHYIEAPRHHMVMEEPRHWKPGQVRPKIPRAADRPRVVLIEPEEVKRIYPHHRDNTGRTVTPHARRGHIKTLRSPRYKEAQGRRLVIRPTWVGDPEWEHAGTRYKVIYRTNPTATDCHASQPLDI